MHGHAGLCGHGLAEFSAVPLRRASTVGEWVLLNQMVNAGLYLLRDDSRSTWAGSIQETWRAFLGKALDPFSQGRIGKVKGLRGGFDSVASHDLTHGLRAPKDSGLLGLFHQGI